MVTLMKYDQKTLRKTSNRKNSIVALALLAAFTCKADSSSPKISLSKLPENLQKQYEKVKHELTDRNRCLVAFDNSYDAEKMILECSFHTRTASESERRALKYCNEKRKAKEISSPCRLIVD